MAAHINESQHDTDKHSAASPRGSNTVPRDNPSTAHEEHDQHPAMSHGGDHAGHEDAASHPSSARGAAHGNHDKHEGHSPEMFRDRLWVSLLLTGPILYFSDQIQEWFSYEAVSFAGSSWVTPMLATALYIHAPGPTFGIALRGRV